MESVEMSCCAVMEIDYLSEVKTHNLDDLFAVVKSVNSEFDDLDPFSCCWEDRIEVMFRRNVKDPLKQALGYIADAVESSPPFYVFTQASRQKPGGRGYGFTFKQFIEKNGFGEVLTTTPEKNPNSGNYVVVFTWAVNKKAMLGAFQKLFTARYKEKQQKDADKGVRPRLRK